MKMKFLVGLILSMTVCLTAIPQETITVRPAEIDDVLINPGIGFMTFQRFNGDKLNDGKGWTEGFPIVYQDFDGNLENENHPMTSLAYFRVYWKFVEPAKDVYAWDLIDLALQTAKERGQTMLLRIAPYGTGPERDVPDWYREMMGEEKNLPIDKWQTNPEYPRYVEHFGGMIRDLGQRYSGHPVLESVDVSIVGAWGEGAGSERLTQKTREALVDCYLESFPDTDLIMLLTDEKTNKYGLSKRNVGWRVDCLGDMGGFSKTWCHMLDYYPQAIIECGMKDAWKTAPVSLEVCWVMQHWKDMGWDVDYIIDQSLKWHISSFNGKSSPTPKEWEPNVERWLKKMGYRLALRKFTYPSKVKAGETLTFTSWWENKGVAPCYKPFPLALRLKNDERQTIVKTKADIREWLPGDSLYDDSILIPKDVPAGEYTLEIAILDLHSEQPKVKLAIDGIQDDGWYLLGKLLLQ
ncbi:MAG: DUF4832 domain-containing protein [Candidatus Omnitrophota bacterium]|jgi:hypothetical protein|nr:MAG: DUF4832 domain-containing protein [Candidatus Omnitrophota bacterium]